MLEEINKWLEDPKRKYTIGLVFFMVLASSDLKTKYSEFLNTDDEDLRIERLPFLTNKVTAIYNAVRINPEAHAEALKKLAAPALETKNQVKKIIALKQKNEELQSKIDDLEESEDDKTSEIEEMQEELESKNSEIDELKATLTEKGIKVLDAPDLPKTIKVKYDRVKEIVPLMAAIHGELKNPAITNEERKAKADELCSLDDERRSHWDVIEEYLTGKDSVLTEENTSEYSEDPLTRGMQMTRRIDRLKENIRRSKEAIEKHIQNKKPNLEQKVREKLAEYEHELQNLTNEVDEKK